MNVGAGKVEETDSNAVATSKKAEQRSRVPFIAGLSRYGGSCTVHLNTCHVAARLLQNDVRLRLRQRGEREFLRVRARARAIEHVRPMNSLADLDGGFES